MLLILFDKTVLDFLLYFAPCSKRLFLISEWLILFTIFMPYMRKPASTRNDQVENPKPNQTIAGLMMMMMMMLYVYYLFLSIYNHQTSCAVYDWLCFFDMIPSNPFSLKRWCIHFLMIWYPDDDSCRLSYFRDCMSFIFKQDNLGSVSWFFTFKHQVKGSFQHP